MATMLSPMPSERAVFRICTGGAVPNFKVSKIVAQVPTESECRLTARHPPRGRQRARAARGPSAPACHGRTAGAAAPVRDGGFTRLVLRSAAQLQVQAGRSEQLCVVAVRTLLQGFEIPVSLQNYRNYTIVQYLSALHPRSVARRDLEGSAEAPGLHFLGRREGRAQPLVEGLVVPSPSTLLAPAPISMIGDRKKRPSEL